MKLVSLSQWVLVIILPTLSRLRKESVQGELASCLWHLIVIVGIRMLDKMDLWLNQAGRLLWFKETRQVNAFDVHQL